MASLLEQKRNASAKDGRATRVSCAAKSDRSRFIQANMSNKIRFCGSCRAQPSLFSTKKPPRRCSRGCRIHFSNLGACTVRLGTRVGKRPTLNAQHPTPKGFASTRPIQSVDSAVRCSVFDVCLLTHWRDEPPISKHQISNRERIKWARHVGGQITTGPLNSVKSALSCVVTRRKFLGTTIAGSATVLAGTVFQKLAAAVTTSPTQSTFQLGRDLSVNRLGFGAMRLTGEGIWGWPPDRENAKKVLRRAVELGVNFIDTAAFHRMWAAPQRPKNA